MSRQEPSPVASRAMVHAGARRRWDWRSLFRRFRPTRDGTMPAGIVLAVVVVALLVAMLLNADSTLRKSKAKGDGFRQHVAQALADVSDAVGLTLPRQALDSAMGRGTGKTSDIDQLLAEKQAVERAASGTSDTAAGSATTQGSDQGAPPANPESTRPVLRTPTPDNPLTLWVGGDSVGGSFAVQMEPISASTGLFDPILDYKVGTGLARPEYYNWPEHFAKDVIPKQNPDIIVAMFGANDDQNLEVGGKVLDKYTPDWFEEYRQRVGKTMDLMKSPTNDRLVVWAGLPPPGPGSKIGHMDTINYIFWEEASKRPWVTFVDTWAFMGGPGPDYRFVGSMPTADGRTKNMYQKDNLHLATTGAEYLSWAVISHLAKFVDMSATKVANPPADKAPPPGIVERAELPKTADLQ